VRHGRGVAETKEDWKRQTGDRYIYVGFHDKKKMILKYVRNIKSR